MGAPKGNKNRLGKRLTPEHRAKISATMIARHEADPSLGAAVAESNRRRIVSAETKAKMSAAQKQRRRKEPI